MPLTLAEMPRHQICCARVFRTVELVATALCIRFGKLEAVSDVSLTLPSGSQLLVTGPAGSGKTTLLKALAGLIPATSGAVTWDGAREPVKAAFGMVFQSDALFDSMTVLDNVLLPLRKRGVAEPEALERAREALADVGLLEAASKRPQELSGGMKKRAGIARAIVARPAVLLADDPFAGLDPVTEGQIARLLLAASKGKTLIAALPDPVDSLPMRERLHLREGRRAPPPESP